MPFTRLSYSKLWTRDTDFPTYQDSEHQVREDMQYHPSAIRDFINDTFMRELESAEGAAKLGDAQKGNLAATLADIYATLKQLDEDLRTLADGETPGAWRSVVVDFAIEDWVAGEDGYSISIPQATHNRVSAAFGFRVWQTEGNLATNTWATSAVNAVYGTNGVITLSSEEAFSGFIVFFGV